LFSDAGCLRSNGECFAVGGKCEDFNEDLCEKYEINGHPQKGEEGSLNVIDLI
jgi:hypothetical protein